MIAIFLIGSGCGILVLGVAFLVLVLRNLIRQQKHPTEVVVMIGIVLGCWILWIFAYLYVVLVNSRLFIVPDIDFDSLFLWGLLFIPIFFLTIYSLYGLLCFFPKTLFKHVDRNYKIKSLLVLVSCTCVFLAIFCFLVIALFTIIGPDEPSDVYSIPYNIKGNIYVYLPGKIVTPLLDSLWKLIIVAIACGVVASRFKVDVYEEPKLKT